MKLDKSANRSKKILGEQHLGSGGGEEGGLCRRDMEESVVKG